jgi:hypothetical protein
MKPGHIMWVRISETYSNRRWENIVLSPALPQTRLTFKNRASYI